MSQLSGEYTGRIQYFFQTADVSRGELDIDGGRRTRPDKNSQVLGKFWSLGEIPPRAPTGVDIEHWSQ